jgi:hypothetical protein
MSWTLSGPFSLERFYPRRPALPSLLIDTFDLKLLRTQSHWLAKQER